MTSDSYLRWVVVLSLGCLMVGGLLFGGWLLWTPRSSPSEPPLGASEEPPSTEHPAELFRGQEQLRNKQWSAARESFRAAVISAPDNSVAWAHLGGVEALLGDNSAAKTAYERSLALDSENWMAHFNFGLLLARSGDQGAALDHLESSVRGVRAKGTLEQVAAVLKELQTDPSLEQIRHYERFKNLLVGS